MSEININIEMDRVVIEGVPVARPQRVSRSDWKYFWERAVSRQDVDNNIVWGGP